MLWKLHVSLGDIPLQHSQAPDAWEHRRNNNYTALFNTETTPLYWLSLLHQYCPRVWSKPATTSVRGCPALPYYNVHGCQSTARVNSAQRQQSLQYLAYYNYDHSNSPLALMPLSSAYHSIIRLVATTGCCRCVTKLAIASKSCHWCQSPWSQVSASSYTYGSCHGNEMYWGMQSCLYVHINEMRRSNLCISLNDTTVREVASHVVSNHWSIVCEQACEQNIEKTCSTPQIAIVHNTLTE